ncbi:2210_t:CDS:1, partial [Scutellospora calospora]
MSFTNSSKNFNFNINTLKLTPEKLAEWSKRRAPNTLPLSQAFRKESSQPPQPNQRQQPSVEFHSQPPPPDQSQQPSVEFPSQLQSSDQRQQSMVVVVKESLRTDQRQQSSEDFSSQLPPSDQRQEP